MKVICDSGRCGWRGNSVELLTATNPFDDTDTITGCPSCKSIDSCVNACDEPECWQQATCGTPTATGYRTTCGKHRPQPQREQHGK